MRHNGAGLALIVALLMGVGALPANAQADAWQISGEMRVGEKPFLCTKEGGVNPTGRGLVHWQAKDAPKPPSPVNKDRVFRLAGMVRSRAKGEGSIDICGFMTKVAGIGPRGYSSKGYNGKGLVRHGNGDIDKIDQLAWKVAPSVLTANVHKYDDGTQLKSKAGKIVGIWHMTTNVAGGQSCTKGWDPLNDGRENKAHGANLFRVDGVMTVVQEDDFPSINDATDPIDPKNDGKSGPTNIWGNKKEKKPKKPCDFDCETGVL